MSLHQLANHMSARGRGPDSTLVHMTPREVEGLQKLAVAHGTSLTINPDTGLPEAFSLKDLLPTLAGAAINYFAPVFGTAIGGALGLSGAAGTGLAVGAATAAISGDLGKGLQAGLGAYGGAGITDTFTGMGSGYLGSQAAESAVADATAKSLTGEAYDKAVQDSVTNRMASATMSDKFGAGLSFAKDNPMTALKTGAKYLAAAASPAIFAGDVGNTVPTVTPRRPSTPISNERFDPYSQTFERNQPRSNDGYDPYAQLYSRSAAKGGLMSLATGGAVRRFNGETGSAVTPAFTASSFFDPNANFMASTGPDEKMLSYINERFGTNNTATNNTATNTAATNIANTGGGFAATAEEAAAPVTTAASVAAPAAVNAGQDLSFTGNTAANNTGIATLPPSASVAETAPMALNNALTNMGAGKGMSVQDASMKVLGRQLSPTELSNWNSRIGSDDVTAAELSQFSIAAQPERALGTNYSDENKAIREMYLERLGRYPDASGLAYFSTKFGNTVDKDERKIFDDMTTEEFQANAAKKNKGLPTVVTDLTTADTQYIPPGVGGSTSAGQIGGGTTINPNGTITTSPVIPGIPVGGFTGMKNVRDTYEAGGGDLGYTPKFVPTTPAEFDAKYSNTGYQKKMYDYLRGKGPKPTKMTDVDEKGKETYREIMRPYKEAVLGVPARTNTKLNWNKDKGEYERNRDYVHRGRTPLLDAAGKIQYEADGKTVKTGPITYMSTNAAKAALDKTKLTSASGNALAEWAIDNKVQEQSLADIYGIPLETVKSIFENYEASKKPAKNGGLMQLANGGMAYSYGGGVRSEYVNEAGETRVWDRSNGMYRPKTLVKDGKTYTWDTVIDNYKLAGADSGIAGLLDMSGNGPPAGGERSANPNWDGMTAEQKAAFYDANPTFAAITQAGQKALDFIGIRNPYESAIARGTESFDAFRGAPAIAGLSIDRETGLSPGELAGSPQQGQAKADQAEAIAIAGRQAASDDRENAREGIDSYNPSGREGVGGFDASGGYNGSDVSGPADSNSPYASGGMTGYALGGLGSLGGYSDGGRLLRGPGDGVSDSIPASIGDRQPARLADGEFVVPARIVSELGNGSTEAGARALYKMMDRIQANRRKTTGKNSVAVDSKAHKYLPA